MSLSYTLLLCHRKCPSKSDVEPIVSVDFRRLPNVQAWEHTHITHDSAIGRCELMKT